MSLTNSSLVPPTTANGVPFSSAHPEVQYNMRLVLDVLGYSTPARLRRVLSDMIMESPTALDQACAKLLVTEKQDLPNTEGELNTNTEHVKQEQGERNKEDKGDSARLPGIPEIRGASPAQNKRKRSRTYACGRYEVCVQCKREYDTLDNTMKCCAWHDGYLKLDFFYELWNKWEEPVQGPMDSEENMRDYPEGFEWSCCNKPGDGSPCKKSTHQLDQEVERVKRLKRDHFQRMRVKSYAAMKIQDTL